MKTEEDVRTLLREVAHTYETSPPPTPRLVDLGRCAKRRRVGWTAGAVAAAVIVVAATGALILGGNDQPTTVGPVDATEASSSTTAPTNQTADGEIVAVPALLRLDQDQATRILELLGLTVAVSNGRTDCDHVGVVLGQDPDAESRLPIGSTVTIRVGVSAGAYVCDVASDDRRVAHLFEDFADNPSIGGPFDTPVGIGLGGRLVKTLTPEQLSDPAQWRSPLNGYAARTGLVSALDLLREHAVTRQITDAPDSPCASVLQPALASLTGGGHRVRIQPPEGSTSCLDWWSVDLYVNDVGQVVGVDVILSEP
jgi:hypothetical protein